MNNQTKGLIQDQLYVGALLVGTIASGALSYFLSPLLSSEQITFHWQQLIWLILLAPLLEELLFRGGLQRWLYQMGSLKRSLMGFSWANWVTSFLFSVIHLLSQPSWVAVGVLVPSLIFGLFRDRYRSVIPGMGLHIGFNFGYFMGLII